MRNVLERLAGSEKDEVGAKAAEKLLGGVGVENDVDESLDLRHLGTGGCFCGRCSGKSKVLRENRSSLACIST